MHDKLLSISESKALRGIAIFGIVLHNYCHFLRFAVKENEYTFTAGKPQMFLHKLLALDSNLFVHFFSFFGHYGVPVFLFISGFGLVRKYEQNLSVVNQGASIQNGVSIVHFIKSHYLKLLRLMFLGYIGFAIVCYLHPHGYHGYTPGRVIAQLLMYINFLPNPDRIIKPGPYWFFSLMLQLYIIYRLLLYRRRSLYVIILIVVCWLVEAVNYPAADVGGVILNRLRYNFIGGMLPFGLGILYARHGIELHRHDYISVLVISAIVVFAGSFAFWSWLWVPAFVVTGAVATVRLIPDRFLKPCVWAGAISSALFVVHPITREIIISMSYRGYVYSGIIVYLLVSVAMAYLLIFLLKFIKV
ncbi:MAG: acyltransferase [Prevotella sp.]|nr:acyltransferase [Prevotella sp.]